MKPPHFFFASQYATLACICEVIAPKAGNVHLHASFADATWLDFVLSAVDCGTAIDEVQNHGVGVTLLAAVRSTRRVTNSNTNLGMLMLLVPLCAAFRHHAQSELRINLRTVLQSLNMVDAQSLYQAIREANPGGLGVVERGDVQRGQVLPILEAMKLAADRDAVARQYVTDFSDIFDRIVPDLIASHRSELPLEDCIVRAHLLQMAREPDSLIQRKCGSEIAQESARKAAEVIAADWPQTPKSQALFAELDHWLRADGHRRNPGTSADLVTAGLFVTFVQERLLPSIQAQQLSLSSPRTLHGGR